MTTAKAKATKSSETANKPEVKEMVEVKEKEVALKYDWLAMGRNVEEALTKQNWKPDAKNTVVVLFGVIRRHVVSAILKQES